MDNIRELAGSPQRGVYMWKDMSPGFSNDGSNQTQQLLGNPQQQPQQSPGVFVSMATSVYQNTPSPTAAQQQQQQQPQYGGVSAARYQLQQQQQQASMNSYHPALRGGVPVFPPQPLPPTAVSIGSGNNQQQQQSAQVGVSNSVVGNSIGPQAPSPQIKRKATPTRPMSFVRALEMTDSMELNPTDNGSNNVGGGGGSSGGQSSGGRATTPTPPDRGSVYDMNYEISV